MIACTTNVYYLIALQYTLSLLVVCFHLLVLTPMALHNNLLLLIPNSIDSLFVTNVKNIGVDLGEQWRVPSKIEKRPCNYQLLPRFAPPIFWSAIQIFLTSLRQCQEVRSVKRHTKDRLRQRRETNKQNSYGERNTEEGKSLFSKSQHMKGD